MVEPVDSIWLDGRLLPWSDVNVHILTHSLHYGLGAFEGIRAYHRNDGASVVFRLKEHVQRLYNSARLIWMQIPFAQSDIEQACVDVLKKNRMTDGYIRPIAFVGEGAMGIYVADNPVRTSVVAWKWGAYLGQEALDRGITAKISSFPRYQSATAFHKAKMMGQYTNSVIAKREAKLAGYDEAILLDTQGMVCEGTGENIFIVRKNTLITPPLHSAILEGITRDTVLTLAREEGLSVLETAFARDELYLADECFLTGTAAEITPVREVDNHAIGTGKPGPITKRLQNGFSI